MQVGSSCGWFPGGQFWIQLQEQHLQIMLLIHVTYLQSVSQNLQDSQPQHGS